MTKKYPEFMKIEKVNPRRSTWSIPEIDLAGHYIKNAEIFSNAIMALESRERMQNIIGRELSQKEKQIMKSLKESKEISKKHRR